MYKEWRGNEMKKKLLSSLRCRKAGLVPGAVPAVSVKRWRCRCECLVATFFPLATALHLQLDVFVTQQHSLRPLPALDGRLTQLWALSPHALAYSDMAPDQPSVPGPDCCWTFVKPT